jgi:hypothetical protein
MTRIIVEFKAEDDQGREILAAISQFPNYTVERAEMEAHLFLTLARVAWREADRYRASERKRAQREARRVGRDRAG